MTTNKFKPGDKVTLKNHDIEMTVLFVIDEKAAMDTNKEFGVYCGWYDFNSRFEREVFHPDMLEKVED